MVNKNNLGLIYTQREADNSFTFLPHLKKSLEETTQAIVQDDIAFYRGNILKLKSKIDELYEFICLKPCKGKRILQGTKLCKFWISVSESGVQEVGFHLEHGDDFSFY